MIYPHPPQHRRSDAKIFLKDLVGKHKVGVVAIGNGTACRETEELVAEIIAEGVQFSQAGGEGASAGDGGTPAPPVDDSAIVGDEPDVAAPMTAEADHVADDHESDKAHHHSSEGHHHSGEEHHHSAEAQLHHSAKGIVNHTGSDSHRAPTRRQRGGRTNCSESSHAEAAISSFEDGQDGSGVEGDHAAAEQSRCGASRAGVRVAAALGRCAPIRLQMKPIWNRRLARHGPTTAVPLGPVSDGHQAAPGPIRLSGITIPESGRTPARIRGRPARSREPRRTRARTTGPGEPETAAAHERATDSDHARGDHPAATGNAAESTSETLSAETPARRSRRCNRLTIECRTPGAEAESAAVKPAGPEAAAGTEASAVKGGASEGKGGGGQRRLGRSSGTGAGSDSSPSRGPREASRGHRRLSCLPNRTQPTACWPSLPMWSSTRPGPASIRRARSAGRSSPIPTRPYAAESRSDAAPGSPRPSSSRSSREFGVGLYQHDVNPKQLKETLESVIASCVNFVGVDLNTASVSLLRHVSGLNQLTARRIVDYRKEHGPFAGRDSSCRWKGSVQRRTRKRRDFSRLPSGRHPLDRTWIHPESYAVVTGSREGGFSRRRRLREGTSSRGPLPT